MNFQVGLKEKREENSIHKFPLEITSGEGAAFFVLNNNPKDALAKIIDVEQFNFPTKEDIATKLNSFLTKNSLDTEDIDAFILGKYGDNYTDFWYDDFIKDNHTNQNVFSYKNITGDYGTSTSFATWFSVQILLENHIPKECIVTSTDRKIRKILIYNHFEERQHSFILLSKV